jgi:hypothetical protein
MNDLLTEFAARASLANFSAATDLVKRTDLSAALPNSLRRFEALGQNVSRREFAGIRFCPECR